MDDEAGHGTDRQQADGSSSNCEHASNATGRPPEATGNGHPLFGLVGLLDADEARRIREVVADFREDLNERLDGPP